MTSLKQAATILAHHDADEGSADSASSQRHTWLQRHHGVTPYHTLVAPVEDPVVVPVEGPGAVEAPVVDEGPAVHSLPSASYVVAVT